MATAGIDDSKVQEVVNCLKVLKDDETFHRALEYPEAKRAYDHWTGAKRLPAAECEEWQSDETVMLVLGRLRLLQKCCERAGTKVPIHLVRERRCDFTLAPEKSEEPAAASAAPRYRKLRCTCPVGVSYHQTANFKDKHPSGCSVLQGDVIHFEERQGEWVRTASGWLPLLAGGEPLFRIAKEGDQDDMYDVAQPACWKQHIAWQTAYAVLLMFAVKTHLWLSGDSAFGDFVGAIQNSTNSSVRQHLAEL
eukprot:TRINITY_DN22230_c0_g1_i2.p1 TRINITY_DN22230_c0_g1~~TRINITY_DN22230_c0_g1_i2.p1  ORF type:complete len:290 (-),score=49.39 TRINITY_DN22230_c0_g1_i2:136-885(-)